MKTIRQQHLSFYFHPLLGKMWHQFFYCKFDRQLFFTGLTIKCPSRFQSKNISSSVFFPDFRSHTVYSSVAYVGPLIRGRSRSSILINNHTMITLERFVALAWLWKRRQKMHKYWSTGGKKHRQEKFDLHFFSCTFDTVAKIAAIGNIKKKMEEKFPKNMTPWHEGVRCQTKRCF